MGHDTDEVGVLKLNSEMRQGNQLKVQKYINGSLM